MEEQEKVRLAVLETIIKDIKSDTTELKQDIRELRKQLLQLQVKTYTISGIIAILIAISLKIIVGI